MAPKMVDRMKEVVKTPKNIRNICTSAHIHHGKCIAPSTRILLADGMVRTARDIFEEIAKDGAVKEDNEDHIIYSPGKKFTIFSLNKESGQLEKKPIGYAWRLKGGKTISIQLRNRFSVSTTPEHRYTVWKDGFQDVEAKDISIGDRIVCARKTSIQARIDLKKYILESLAKGNFYVRLEKAAWQECKSRISGYGIGNLNIPTGIKPKSFYHGLWQNRLSLLDFLHASRIFGWKAAKAYDAVASIYYRTGKQRGQNSLPMKLPRNFEDLFYCAGLFFGDGSGKKFIVGKEQLAADLERICEVSGIKAARGGSKDRTPEIHTTMTFARLLHHVFGYPLEKKAHNIRVSEILWRCGKRYSSRFLRGYFDTDGCVESSRRAVTITSASKKMVEDVHLLLLRFGCIAIQEKDNTLTISGRSALQFQKEIGFGLKEKAARLQALAAKVSGSTVLDKVEVGSQLMLMQKTHRMMPFGDLAFVEVTRIEEGHEDVVYDFTIPENNNFVAEGMVIHNTAFTDNLLAASGLMAEALAGDLEKGMATWQHSDEQERLLTVDAANVSMVHSFAGQDYLINLIDTPGHVDFGGNVTRAMRAIDGTIVLVCASEGIMPQTETVLKQALKERVKPVLFINKVDRIMNEMKLTPEKIQERIAKLIIEFNKHIERIAEPEFKEKWKVNIQDGSVAFGSARDNWALSLPFMQKKNIKFIDIVNAYNMQEEDRKKWFWENSPVNEVILDMVVKHLPTPVEAQAYRIPKIWQGELDSPLGKSMTTCDPNGKLAFCITRVLVDQKSGREISAGRLFSGTMRDGMTVYINNTKQYVRVQNVYMYLGVKTEPFEVIPAGNVLAIAGIQGFAGDTLTEEPDMPFVELKHIFEPVITKAIKVTKPQDLPKLVEVLKEVAKEDPSIKIEINEETGENLISGMGELHLEIVENRVVTEKGLKIQSSSPIIVYRESIQKVSQEIEGKTPNKHNKFYFIVEPLPDEVVELIRSGQVPEGRIRKKNLEIRDALVAVGMESKEAQSIKDIFNGNVFEDATKGQVHLGEVMEMVLDMFEDVMKRGPIAREPSVRIKVKLTDMKLHEDAIHRGPAQVYPAIRDGIRGAMMTANPVLFEPMQVHLIEVPYEMMGEISKLVGSKRGQLLDIQQIGEKAEIKAKLPVAEMIGWASDLRSATEGRGHSSLVSQTFEKVPSELQDKISSQIKQRKGLTDAMVGV
ncbi:elongation factor EF-2 [Candidatus Woesearchaeota archaeon]|nr:elongation factor EF-2 [Candidatus Woesearchaeota archaeon]